MTRARTLTARQARKINGLKRLNFARSHAPRQTRDASSGPVSVPSPDASGPLHHLILTLEQLEPRSCRYPYGEGPPFQFCGQPKAHIEASYCEHHERVCFQVRPRRRRATA